MSAAGDKLTTAVERHSASIAASRESAQRLAEERNQAVAALANETPSPGLFANAPATEAASE